MLRHRRLVWAAGLVALALVIQLIPYGHAHSNPAVTAEPPWASVQTRELAARACYDCHSNATSWPWYSNVAPLSWVVQRDVAEGRRQLNFSTWDRPQPRAREAAESVQLGAMPPSYYDLVHPAAFLTPEERDALVRSLEAISRDLPAR